MYLVTLHQWLFYILTPRVSFLLQKYIRSKYRLLCIAISPEKKNKKKETHWSMPFESQHTTPVAPTMMDFFFPPLKAKKKEFFTDRVSRLRSYPPHPGFEEHWSPPVQRSSSPFHQNSLTHHHLVLYARRELFRCQIKKRKSSSSVSVKFAICVCGVISILPQPSFPWHTCCS